ncbi:hypothetical protein GUJ93_ZPchr0002g23875 [Zizania palustris]|uniref:Alpha/beta hydrolase fold-3 domain-containing protein n=1 Tax=Zizania palustris TaxID=103762 RepID=A0A8J5S0I6_ZIZPA|nr:hypothetical protein GUJ93_ZPchr0002g23875 [Zizania palustris]
MADASAGGDEVIHDARDFNIRVYQERPCRALTGDRLLPGVQRTPPPGSHHSSKDVGILLGEGVSARIYLPAPSSGGYRRRIPVIVFFHGGGFCRGSASDAATHGHANQLAAWASAIVVSVEYSLAPQRLVPALYGDAWAALAPMGGLARR